MNLSEVRDSFVADYKFECRKRNVKEFELTDKQLALWISEGQQDIVNRVKPIKAYQDVSVISGITDYSLNTNYGNSIRAEVSGQKVDIVSLDEIITTGTVATSSIVSRCATYWDSANGVHKVKVEPSPTESYTLRLWYYVDTLFYSPSGATAQDWGSFSGKAFTGDLKMPDKYLMAVKYFMLSKAFDDFYIKYENEVRRLEGSVSDSMNETFSYNLGI